MRHARFAWLTRETGVAARAGFPRGMRLECGEIASVLAIEEDDEIVLVRDVQHQALALVE